MTNSKHINTQTGYGNWAATYDMDENSTRDLDALITRKTLGIVRCETILEIGCGTGKNTVLLAQLAKSVHALDFSPEMLAVAKNKVVSENVRFKQADLTQKWPFPNETADWVVCNLVLEHIEDLHFIFSEANRSLGKNGRFFISELHPFLQYQGLQATFKRDGVAIAIQAFVHHLSDFLDAAADNGFSLLALREWWHENDQERPPRLVSFMFEKTTPTT